MRRAMLIVLLSLGTVGGFAAGFAHHARWWRGGHQAFERHVAEVCVDAARHATEAKPASSP